MITHDLGVIAETCDDVVVMYAGRVAETRLGRLISFTAQPTLYTKGSARIHSPTRQYPERTNPPSDDSTATSRACSSLPVGARFAPALSASRSQGLHAVRPSTRLPNGLKLVEIAPGHWVEDHPVVRVDSTSLPEPMSNPPSTIADSARTARTRFEIRGRLRKYFPGQRRRLPPGQGATEGRRRRRVLPLLPGETLGLVGRIRLRQVDLGKVRLPPA
jgi:ABC-type glutathione transport system ATPase component